MRKSIFNLFDWENDYFFNLLNLFPRPIELQLVKDRDFYKTTNFLKVLDDAKWVKPEIFGPEFKFDEKELLWVLKIHVGKECKPNDIDVQTNANNLSVYSYTTSSSGSSSSSVFSCGIPGDPNTLKAKLKGGVLTITCEPIKEVQDEDVKNDDFDPELEYEIEIG